MPGPVPKPAHLRQRKNRHSTAATLPSEADSAGRPVPPLPPRERKAEVWHPNVLDWWTSVWRSPMAAEFLGPDMTGGLYLLAELHQQRWTCSDPKVLVSLAAEIRQQEVRFGLSPIDRRRLQWEIERAEEAEEKAEKRKTKKKAATPDATKDPRQVLKVVS